MKEAAGQLGVTRWAVRGYRRKGWLPNAATFTADELAACAERMRQPRAGGPLRGAAARSAALRRDRAEHAGSACSKDLRADAGGAMATPPTVSPPLPRAPRLNLPCRADPPPPAEHDPAAPPPAEGTAGGDPSAAPFFNEDW